MMKLSCVLLLIFATLAFGHQLESASLWEDVSASLLENINSEQPPYKVLSRTDKYEERLYEEADYVVTNSTGVSFPIALTKSVALLYSYFLGRNEDGVRIERTTPVFTRFLPKEDFSGLRALNFSIGMYLPREYQGNAPKPKSDNINIVRGPEARAYAREFGGFATEGKALEEAVRLKADLLEDKVRDFNDDYFDLAVYDPPTTLTQRHNEVIFEASSTATAGPMMRVPEGVLAQLRHLYAELFN